MKVVWSDAALADLERFAEFLHREYPSLAAKVAAEIIAKVAVLTTHPRLEGRLPDGRNIARSRSRFSAKPMCFNIESMANAS